MNYNIVIHSDAVSDMKSLPKRIRRQVDAKISALATNPHPNGSKALKGNHNGLFRVRSGDYRIIYQVRDSQLTVVVVKVGNRKDVYD